MWLCRRNVEDSNTNLTCGYATKFSLVDKVLRVMSIASILSIWDFTVLSNLTYWQCRNTYCLCTVCKLYVSQHCQGPSETTTAISATGLLWSHRGPNYVKGIQTSLTVDRNHVGKMNTSQKYYWIYFIPFIEKIQWFENVQKYCLDVPFQSIHISDEEQVHCGFHLGFILNSKDRFTWNPVQQ